MRVFSAVCVGVALAFAAFACGTDPVGVDACRRIETVRCESAPACGIDLSRPVHNTGSDEAKSAVAACIRYYDDACLHGIEPSEDPGSVKTQACVDAIITGSCDIVKTPENHPDCAWLVPPPPPAAPPTPAPVADAATE